MSSRNRIFVITVVVFALLAAGIASYLFFRPPATQPRSLLLYTNYQSPETITNWIVDTDTGEKWEVGKGLAAWHWSPSGKYLIFHTLSPLPRQIWISNPDGSKLRQVLDGTDYPDLEIKNFDWLTGDMILVNVVRDAQSYTYLLKLNTLTFEQIPDSGGFIKVSPSSQFWLEFSMQNKYSFFNLDGRRTPLPSYLGDYYFSPTEDKIAYSCAGEYKFSSLCIADINISGITNERKVAENAFLNAYGETWWSQDGKYIGFLYYSEENKETRFRAINVSSGAIAYDWIFPTKDTRNFWSPRGDKIIDWGGLLLDLRTGQVSSFFTEIGETIPSYVVDWRMIEVP
ncbi:MAG: hypothetical protein AB1516_15135 [Pseudomonadota bacterium]